jgi:Raf kinase inhibitor-like YbhB/YbcL family protein
MNSGIRKSFSLLTRTCFDICVLTPSLLSTAYAGDGQRPEREFRLSSTTFQNDILLPISMIFNFVQNGSNVCSFDGSPGGDQSPGLAWTNAPRATRSFVVIAYDTTAAFTHGGIYNISRTATGLPANAGVAGSTYGDQINNDFGAASYDGLCPPTTLTPFVHDYVLTVYALNTDLNLFSASTNFPANAETLYHALIEAGRDDHILETASIRGLYSAVPIVH